jgi:4-carboxymuconolactone decarboxylase
VWRSEYETYAPEATGRAAGLTDAEVGALGSLRPDALTDGQHAEAAGRLGAATLFELSALVGCHAALALQLRIFRVPVPG